MPSRFFVAGVLPALVFQFIGTWLYFVVLADTPSASPVYTATKVLMLTWPLLWLWFKAPIPKIDIQPTTASILWGLASGTLIAGSILAAGWLLFPLLSPHSAAITARIDDFIAPSSYIALALAYSTVHSLFEEYFWRWFVLRGLLTRLTFPTVLFIGSVAFTSHHAILLSQFFPGWIAALGTIGVFVGGMFWSWLAYKQRSLVGAWISHFFADAAIFAVGYFLLF